MSELLIDFVRAQEPGCWLLIGEPSWADSRTEPHNWLLGDQWPEVVAVGAPIRLSAPSESHSKPRRSLRMGVIESIERSEVTAQNLHSLEIKPVNFERLIVRVLDLPVVDPSRTINYRQDGIDRGKRRRGWRR